MERLPIASLYIPKQDFLQPRYVIKLVVSV